MKKFFFSRTKVTIIAHRSRGRLFENAEGSTLSSTVVFWCVYKSVRRKVSAFGSRVRTHPPIETSSSSLGGIEWARLAWVKERERERENRGRQRQGRVGVATRDMHPHIHTGGLRRRRELLRDRCCHGYSYHPLTKASPLLLSSSMMCMCAVRIWAVVL